METTEQDPKQDRYRIGCAGMFMLGMDYGVADEDEAIANCESGPMGCEVYDSVTNRWIGPTCQEEIDHAKARLLRRAESSRLACISPQSHG